MALLREVIELPQARIEVEQHEGLLFIVETGQLRTAAEVDEYIRRMDDIIRRTQTDHAVVDARGETGDPPPEVRERMWRWILEPGRGFSIIAFVLPTEMAIARVNMTALSQGAKVRAFDSVFAAQRWIRRGPRFTTSAPFRPPSSRPPPMSKPSEEARSKATRAPGFYTTTTPQVEQLGPSTAPPGRGGRDPEKASSSSAPPMSQSDFRSKRPFGTGHGGEGGQEGGGQRGGGRVA